MTRGFNVPSAIRIRKGRKLCPFTESFNVYPQKRSLDVGVHVLDEVGVDALDLATPQLQRRRHHVVFHRKRLAEKAEIADFLVRGGVFRVVFELLVEDGEDLALFEKLLFVRERNVVFLRSEEHTSELQ